jgi:hypothetical protein
MVFSAYNHHECPKEKFTNTYILILLGEEVIVSCFEIFADTGLDGMRKVKSTLSRPYRD